MSSCTARTGLQDTNHPSKPHPTLPGHCPLVQLCPHRRGGGTNSTAPYHHSMPPFRLAFCLQDLHAQHHTPTHLQHTFHLCLISGSGRRVLFCCMVVSVNCIPLPGPLPVAQRAVLAPARAGRFWRHLGHQNFHAFLAAPGHPFQPHLRDGLPALAHLVCTRLPRIFQARHLSSCFPAAGGTRHYDLITAALSSNAHVRRRALRACPHPTILPSPWTRQTVLYTRHSCVYLLVDKLAGQRAGRRYLGGRPPSGRRPSTACRIPRQHSPSPKPVLSASLRNTLRLTLRKFTHLTHLHPTSNVTGVDFKQFSLVLTRFSNRALAVLVCAGSFIWRYAGSWTSLQDLTSWTYHFHALPHAHSGVYFGRLFSTPISTDSGTVASPSTPFGMTPGSA